MITYKSADKLEFLNSMRLAKFFFEKRTRYTLLYAIIVPGLFIALAFIKTFEYDFTRTVAKRPVIQLPDKTWKYSITAGEMFIFMTFKVWYWSVDFVSKLTFELLITPIGGVLVQYLMHKMLLTEDSTVFGVSPSSCEYTMTEGSKALAKIVRLVFIGFINCFLDVTSDFYYIYSQASQEYKKFTFLIMACYAIMAVIKLAQLSKVFYYTYDATQLNSKKEKLYVEIVDNLSVVKTSREEAKVTRRFQKSLNDWESVITKIKLLEYSNTFLFTIGFDTVTSLAMIFYISDFAKNNPELSPKKYAGSINLYHDIILKIPRILNNCIKFYQQIGDSIALAQKLLEYMVYSKHEVSKKVKLERFEDKIEVKDLVYFAKEKLVFSGVNFEINKGDKIALYGRNGSGKSSIFKLILGFDEFQGSITINGVDIRALDMPEYRKLITYVPQDTKLFDESIFYNLTFGNDASYQRVIEECKKMKIHDTIMAFPNGYNTVVGEEGQKLNGGLRQKIFYTRAFLNDSDIYMFDEPTNNLDSHHSQFLLEYLNDPAYANKTFFVIAHDLEIIRKFPKILQFDEGKINEVKTL